MKLKDYKNEYIFIEANGMFDLIKTGDLKRYVTINKISIYKLYGAFKTKSIYQLDERIQALFYDDLTYDGFTVQAENLTFEDENYKKAMHYLNKFADKVNEDLYQIDLKIEIEE